MIARRSFLFGAGASLIAAPAIVRAASLMPVSSAWVRRPGTRLLTAADGLTVEKMLRAKHALREFSLEPGAINAVYLPPGTFLALHF